MIDKEKLIKVSLSYLDTPHHNGAMVKGAGVDCCTLPALIYKEMGLADIEIQFGYPADWYCMRECNEILLPYLEKYFTPAEELQIGDLISFSWGRAKYAHTAVYLGENMCIHSHAGAGVEVLDLDSPYFVNANGKSRITGIWRLKWA